MIIICEQDGTHKDHPGFATKKAVMQHLARHALMFQFRQQAPPMTKAMVKEAKRSPQGKSAGGSGRKKKKKGKKGRR